MISEKKNCPEWGSNSRPPDHSVDYSDYETDALTNCATEAPSDQTQINH